MSHMAGWANHFTWLAHIAMDDGGEARERWLEETRACLEQAAADTERFSPFFLREEKAVYLLAETMCFAHEAARITAIGGLSAQLLDAAYAAIDWVQIAKHWVQAVEKIEKEEEAQHDG